MGVRPGLIIWLDPGKTTGIAAWYQDEQVFASLEADFQATGQWIEMAATLRYDPSVIFLGWESYIVTPGGARGGSASYPLEVIGMARWIGLSHGLTILQAQPSSMKSFSSDARLKILGWYKPGKGHANDAARHLLRYCLKEHILPNDMWRKVLEREESEPSSEQADSWV